MLKQLKTSYVYQHYASHKTVMLRPVQLKTDWERLYQWSQKPHVLQFWDFNKPKTQVLNYFRRAIENKHQSVFMLIVNHVLIGYAEVYAGIYDRIQNFHTFAPDDYGIHLFIGDPQAINQRNAEPIIAALCDYLFTELNANRVFLEPNIKVAPLTVLHRKMGFKVIAPLKLPEKIALLNIIDAQTFYQHYPKLNHQQQNNISSDTSAWPLVRIHFPDHPPDQAVINWLAQMDDLLKLKKPCVVITTFAQCYQFSQQARRYQALWFKKNVQRLAQSCLAMIRVTQDQNMIAKITSNAMRKGMPFSCIPAKSLQKAEQIAKQLIQHTDYVKI